MHQLIYMSTATRLMTDDELQTLLEQARLNNAKYDITGLLLYHEGRFMQLIEGPTDAVRKLYSYIEQDGRHTDTAKLADKEVEVRSFPTWSMAFWPVQSEDLSKVSGFLMPEQMQLPAEGLSGADALLLKIMQDHMMRSEA
ncbi:BLUF domain-containing protein [Hymenobacter wooponensis]|uniref:BLUF domain-containing protein n=1 Tax=Hymenobacter wooponensis TaxID=1525360 RepID=A0A4Z0MQZ8_9BACT|nr:BLUF domain-containing protein [Hymenobacter wooponensis]TGD81869.1 BLUF domain-containing protein [Hymenobacter wooponensis]